MLVPKPTSSFNGSPSEENTGRIAGHGGCQAVTHSSRFLLPLLRFERVRLLHWRHKPLSRILFFVFIPPVLWKPVKFGEYSQESKYRVKRGETSGSSFFSQWRCFFSGVIVLVLSRGSYFLPFALFDFFRARILDCRSVHFRFTSFLAEHYFIDIVFFCLLDCLVLAILTFLIWFAWWELDSGRVWSLARNVMRYRFFFCLFLVSRDEK